ncbi:MAG: SurA N-terminal domain-containing protein [Bilophila sp.]
MLLSLPVAHAAAPLNKIAAVVNGEMITSFDLQAEMSPEMLRAGLDFRNPAHAESIDALARKILEAMITNIILTQEAERLKVSVGESEVDGELRKFMERSKLTAEEFQRQLQLQRVTEKAFRERIRNGILRSRLLATMVGRKVVVTKEEIATYYETHKQTLMNNQQVRFAVLVYPPSADATKYAARIKSGASTFEQIAREVSVGPKAQEGGDLGLVNWADLDTAWRDRLSGMQPGSVSPVFDFNGLKGQVKLLSLSSGSGQSLEEASPQIESILREPKLQERFGEYSEQLRKRAVVEIRL